MYEMYPQTWAAAEGRTDERPRRRPRKEHSVVPALVARLEAERTRAQG